VATLAFILLWAMVKTRTARDNSKNKAVTLPVPSDTPKKKNKVAAVRSLSLKSPKAAKKEAAEDDGSLASDASASTTFSRGGLSHHIQKQLSIDIETEVGIEKLTAAKDQAQDLRKFLDKKNSERGDQLYGERGDLIRTQIQKKIYRWSLLEAEGT
jgi:hypothetical protein